MPLDIDTLRRHQNPVFVETGASTCNGTILALRLGVPLIYLIELDEGRWTKAVNRFYEPQVRVVWGDSGTCLGDVIANVDVPITFWLDAHGKDGRSLEDKPLLRELAAIAAHPLRLQHTVLIDDWDLVEHSRRCPHLTEQTVRAALKAINPDFRLSRVDGLLHAKREPCWLVMVAEPKGDA